MEEQLSELRMMMGKEEVHKAKVIAITSGKGGVGKTNISINIAIAYAQLGKSVILIDADMGMANSHVLLNNMVPDRNLMHVINRQKKMSEIVLDTEYGFKFIAGANGFSKLANLSKEDLEAFAKEFTSLSNADIIIIDTGAGVAENVLQFVAAADEVCIVTNPEPPAIADAYGIIKIIVTELADRELNLRLLVNRALTADEAKRVSDRIITIAGQFLNFKVHYIGFIYDDPVVPAAVKRQKPFMIVNPTSKPSVCIKHLVKRMEKSDDVDSSGVSSFLQKFVGGKKKR